MQHLIFETLEICWIEGSSNSNIEDDFDGSVQFRELSKRVNVTDGITAYLESDDPDYCKRVLLVVEQPVDNHDVEILGHKLFNCMKLWRGQMWLHRRYVAEDVETRVVRNQPKMRALTSAPSPMGGGCSI